MDYYVRIDEVRQFTMVWMDLTNIILSAVRGRGTDTERFLSFAIYKETY